MPVADSNDVLISFHVPNTNSHQEAMEKGGGEGVGSSMLPILVRDTVFVSILSRKQLSDGRDDEKEGGKRKKT